MAVGGELVKRSIGRRSQSKYIQGLECMAWRNESDAWVAIGASDISETRMVWTLVGGAAFGNTFLQSPRQAR